MDISSASSVSSALSQARTSDAVAVTVLKKAIDIQAQTAAQLIQALPQPPASSNGSLGSNINTFA